MWLIFGVVLKSQGCRRFSSILKVINSSFASDRECLVFCNDTVTHCTVVRVFGLEYISKK